ncbi:MAG: leucyl aminopeptidase [Gammaproteobacteria bacterium]|nr:leucyl aminopeptidase [Gammaproteobacteria bacterium]
MQYQASENSPSRQICDCIVVGIYEKRSLNTAAAIMDKSSRSALSQLARKNDLPAALGEATVLRKLAGVKAARVLVVGLGKKTEFGLAELEKATTSAVQAITKTGAKSVAFYLAENGGDFSDIRQVVFRTVVAAHKALYRFDQMKSKPSKNPSRIKKLILGCADAAACEEARNEFAAADALSQGIALARDLGNLPANVCTPDYLADEARRIGRDHKSVTTKIMGRKDLEKFGMGAFISVTQGAQRPPRLIQLHYRGGAKTDAPVALVGKGITFDTGGISLKPPPGMDEMKFDMCGAAAVLGTMQALAKMQLPINVVGIIPACENMPSGTATRPGDIVTTMDGKTVEILNTDAEGRLILCDALCYAKTFKPSTIIDIATLTGACVIALGDHYSGLMSPHDELASELLTAGVTAGDLAWRMPVAEHYVKNLKSNFADFANVGGRPAGAITAACYLWQFVKDQNWAHLDIAGSAWESGSNKGATGRPVGLLIRYLMNKGQQ